AGGAAALRLEEREVGAGGGVFGGGPAGLLGELGARRVSHAGRPVGRRAGPPRRRAHRRPALSRGANSDQTFTPRGRSDILIHTVNPYSPPRSTDSGGSRWLPLWSSGPLCLPLERRSPRTLFRHRPARPRASRT